MMQFTARRYDTQQVVQMEVSQGCITRLMPSITRDERDIPWVAPGFVDLQVNGYMGQEFSSAELTSMQVATIVRQHESFGVTGICPTLTTNSLPALGQGMRAIAAACDESPEVARRVVGIHLEGPYMSTEDGPRGAHPLAHCRRPNWDEFQRLQEAAGGRIVILTMSAEFDEAPEFIAKVTGSGVVVAIGHTSANSAQIMAAVDAGASMSTHLGNGAHRQLRRHPNYLWDQMAEDRLTASIIADGHHLPPEVIKTIVRAKTPGRVVLVSDVSGLAGLPVGRYQSSGCELEILPDGRLVIAGQDQLLAGASRPIGDGVAKVMRFAGVDLATAIDMATRQPLQLLGRRPIQLRLGGPADLVLFDLESDGRGGPISGLTIRATLCAGAIVFGQVSHGA